MLQFLVVDPDDGVSDVLREELQEAFDAGVMQARTGELATRVLHERPLDLAVIEAMLPDMSGFELAERSAYCNVPALLISGHPVRQEACRAYGYPHLEKPFPLHDLADAARTLVCDGQQAIARLHRSYERLTSTASQSITIDEIVGHTIAEAQQIRNASRRIRENAAVRLPFARTPVECSIVLEKIIGLRALLRQSGTGLGPGTERMARLLLTEEEAKLVALLSRSELGVRAAEQTHSTGDYRRP